MRTKVAGSRADIPEIHSSYTRQYTATHFLNSLDKSTDQNTFWESKFGGILLHRILRLVGWHSEERAENAKGFVFLQEINVKVARWILKCLLLSGLTAQ